MDAHRPGRACPAHFALRPGELAGPASFAAGTLYVAGGVYGNRHALAALAARVAAEPEALLVLAGDLHRFDAEPGVFAAVQAAASAFPAIAGNVELQLADPAGAGDCGCAYPDHVDGGTVARSNAIMARLQAAADARHRAALATLPRHLTVTVGPLRVAVVHGDLGSVSGWGFALEHLAPPEAPVRARLGARARTTPAQVKALAEAGADVVACAHTCLPCLYRVGDRVVVNNGAAGMPRFRGHRTGVATRISVHGPAPDALYGTVLAGVHIEAVPVPYDHAAWLADFDTLWPAGSAAALSYRRRMLEGPDLDPAEAVLEAAW